MIKPFYIKDSPYIKQFSYLNSLCMRAIKAITNHTSIGEYCLKFFLKESLSCLYRTYPIETRQYILYKYRRYNKYWNSLRTTFSHFLIFLEFNLSTFSFHEGIT